MRKSILRAGDSGTMRRAMVVGALLALALALGVGATPAGAFTINGPVITSSATNLGGGGFLYSYTIDYRQGLPVAVPGDNSPFGAIGPGPVVLGLTLPFFDPAPVAINPGSIQSPAGWVPFFGPPGPPNTWVYNPALDAGAKDYDAPPEDFISPPLVLHWSTPQGSPFEVHPGQILGGFSFTSAFGPDDGPALLTFTGGAGAIGFAADPVIPNTPNSPFAPVPEPLTAGLGAMALAGIALAATRRWKRRS